MELDSEIGICVKNYEGFILERNLIAVSTCGQFCDQICMKKAVNVLNNNLENKKAGFHCYSKIKTKENKIADLIIALVQNRVVTLIYPLDNQIQFDLSQFIKFNLTVSEKSVLGYLLKGHTNQEIANLLFISKSTLKKHLNNIYKKIPQELRPR